MKHKPLNHQSYLLVFGALSTLVVGLLVLADWQYQQAYKAPLVNQAIILTPQQMAKLWAPVKAGSSTNMLTASATAQILKPMQGGQKLTADQEHAMFAPIQANMN